MAIEITFGSHLGELRYAPESLILAHRGHEQLPESSLRAFAAGLHALLVGMASDCSEFVLAPDGAQFFFLLIVRKPTLGLDMAQTVQFTVGRTRRVSIYKQMAAPAAQIACQLSDLGTPPWLDSSRDAPASGPRQPARLDASDLLTTVDATPAPPTLITTLH